MGNTKYNNKYSNLVDATNDLMKRGFTEDFKLTEKGFCSMKNPDTYFGPKDLKIVEYHRFEGASNPDDMSVIYVIETSDGKKGTLIDAYGTYSSHRIGELMKEVPVVEQGDKDKK